jgi:hypothetical protein
MAQSNNNYERKTQKGRQDVDGEKEIFVNLINKRGNWNYNFPLWAFAS